MLKKYAKTGLVSITATLRKNDNNKVGPYIQRVAQSF